MTGEHEGERDRKLKPGSGCESADEIEEEEESSRRVFVFACDNGLSFPWGSSGLLDL